MNARFERLFEKLPEVLVHDEQFVCELEKICKVVTVKKGDYLLRGGEVCQAGYFINRGVFLNQFVNERGEVFVTGFASEDHYPFFSVIGYFTRQPSDFEIKAVENSEVFCFPRSSIEDFSLRYPAFASYYQGIMMYFISRLDLMLAMRLSSTAEEFIKYLYLKHQWIINRVPDKYIAQYMGISNAWYCKLKKKMLSTM